MRVFTAFLVLFAAAVPVRADRTPPPWLPRYDLAVNLDVPNRTAKVTQQVSWVNRSDKPVEELVFNVHSRYAPPDRVLDRVVIAKMLEIMKVPAREGLFDKPAFKLNKVEVLTPNDGGWKRTEVSARFRGDISTALVVPLPNPVPPGGSAAVSIDFTMELPNKQGRWGQWHEVTCLSNWHPVLAFHDGDKGWQPTPFVPWHQPFYNEAGVFNVRVRFPKGLKLGCTGSVRKTTDDGETQEAWVGPVVARDWTMLVSDRYQTFEMMTDGPTEVKVKCLAFPEHAHYAKALIKHAARAVDAYSRWFGPYPYPELTIAESYFGWNGNECSGLIMIDERVFAMPHFAEGYAEYLISHEVCHQWFYNVIGTDGFRETFMDEAFATYFAHRLLNQAEGKNNSLLQFPKGLGWLPGIKREDYRYSQFYATLRNGELAPPLQEMTKYRHVGNLFSAAYDRGGKIVGVLEDRLGEAAFFDFMRRVHSRYYFKVLKADAFRKELEEYTGKPWGDFFKQWLHENGMTDWAVESVEVAPPEVHAGYRTTVILRQQAEYDEPTELGFSFDDGTTYKVRVPVVPADGRRRIDSLQAVVEPMDDHRVRVAVMLPQEPKQIAVDPDQVLPDVEPANNLWKPSFRWRLTPFYTMLEETAFTTAYDRWNFIFGPWFYGPSYPDAWFTRSTVVGLRAGAYRTEQFNGGAYVGYRPSYRDLAVGIDGSIPHWPFGRTETGFHAEKALAQFTETGTDLDRAAVWTRYVIDESPSLYTAPMHHIEGFAAWQRNFLPVPRNPVPGGTRFDQITQLGVHYHLDLLTPYWDPEDGVRFDASYAIGLPVFGQSRVTHQAWAQISAVKAPPERLGWLSKTRFAVRALGAWASPEDALLFALGGDMQFRGFDLAERQGRLMWVGSAEWRVPVLERVDLDAVDHFFRLKNVYLAPFYDVGDVTVNGRGAGPMAHAVGLGVRFDVAWFSFLERTMLRLDVAKTVNVDSPVQFWVGLQHPF
jgi:hypothetical protein